MDEVGMWIGLKSNHVWSGLTLDLRVREDGPIEINEALRRAHRIIANVEPYYKSGEEAMAANNFALSFAKDYFFTFDVHSPTNISLYYELPGIPWYKRYLRHYTRGHKWNWRNLNSETHVCRMIELFFTLPQLSWMRCSSGSADEKTALES